jgi:outer membrane protein OmpA-like peptidoglycan-associated protein
VTPLPTRLVGGLAGALLVASGSTASAATTPTGGPVMGPVATGAPATFPVEDVSGEVQDLVFPEASADGAVVDEGDGGYLLASDVLFAFDRADLTARARAEITRIAGELKDRAGGAGRVSVTGHTDAVGDAAYNLGLSRRRAEAVRAELARLLGPQVRVTATGRGEQEPVADNRTKAGQALNRRVEIRPGS